MAYETNINKSQKSYFVPTPEEEVCRTRLYENVAYMRELKDKTMPHFQSGPEGARSFNTYLDDSERILNGYTPSREDQGKEEWRSNLMDNVSRAKLRAIAAGVGLKVPEMAFVAKNKDGMRDAKRAEVIKSVVQTTYKTGNSNLYNYQEIWHTMSHGVVFEYEGYKTGGANQEVIDSFDSLTGKVTTHKEYRKMDGKPFSVIINPQDFYWWTFFVNDIQDQPRLAWIQHYTKNELELEFSKFPNYKFVKDKTEASNFTPAQNSIYYEEWSKRVGEKDDYEVIRYFSKADEGQKGKYGYEVWVNGVPLIQAPLLWGDKVKVYPFAKQIAEPFANTNFFVGMSLPAILEAYQEGKNTILNTLIDKLYRAVDPMKLVGLQNRDLLDVEADITSSDNTTYVPDISAVKFMNFPEINQGELALLQVLDRGIETLSVDRSQQGITPNQTKTATQAQIEDIRAREIKGALYLFLEDLWRQKTKLRIEIVLTHFLKDKASQENVSGKIITVKDYTFGDGSRGVLDIYVAKRKSDRLSSMDIEAREQAMAQQGIAYKLISMDMDYLDEWELDFEIVPDAFHKQDKMAEEQDLMSEVQQVTTLYPEFYVANKDKYLARILALHGKHPDEYNPPAPPAQPTEEDDISESMSYKDAPPSIRRQMEKNAGYEPATEDEVSPNAPEENKLNLPNE